MLLGSAESEHPRLTNRANISEEFQPQSTNVTDGQVPADGQTDRRTDRQHTNTIAIPCSALYREIIKFFAYYRKKGQCCNVVTVAALTIDNVGPTPYHFRLGPTSGPASRFQEVKKYN